MATAPDPTENPNEWGWVGTRSPARVYFESDHGVVADRGMTAYPGA